MKKLFVVPLLLVVAFSFAQQDDAGQEHPEYALVIGNGNYTSFGSLSNTINDANDMATALQSLGFTVDKVLDGNRAQMVEAITRLKNRLSVSGNSYGFVFYAGHGVQFNGVNYLVPAKADIPSANYLGDTAISVQAMLAELNDAGNQLNVVVLDACRDFPAAWNRSANRGLAMLTSQPADSIIVYATSAGSTASDGEGRNGLFTGYLLKNLATPGLEVSEIFRLTGADVAQASGRMQLPAIYNQFYDRAWFGQQATTQPQPIAAARVQSTPQPGPATPVQPTPQPAPAPASSPLNIYGGKAPASFYWDGGIGLGLEKSTIDDTTNYSGNKGVSMLLKAGYGPFGNAPVYTVFDFNYLILTSTGLGDDNNDIFSDMSIFAGFGILYYPIRLIQLGASLGWSGAVYSYWENNNTSTFSQVYALSNGFGWNILAAFDFGLGDYGCLMGLQYSGAINKLDHSVYDSASMFEGHSQTSKLVSSNLWFVVKIAHRKKVTN